MGTLPRPTSLRYRSLWDWCVLFALSRRGDQHTDRNPPPPLSELHIRICAGVASP